MAKRFDIGTLASPTLMPNGSLIVDAKLTRTGVFKYANPDGSERLEYRPESAVFDEASLATFPFTSVTNNHPDKMVTPETANAVTVGVVAGSVRKLDNHVAAQLIVYDAKAISDIRAGKRELSCGYTADVDDTPGVSPSGERYDSSQSNIVINHVAIVDVGRAGPEAKIHMDSARQIPIKDEKITMDPEIKKKITDLELAVLTETARADKAEADIKDQKARADKAEAFRDSEKERADKAEKQHQDSVDGLSAKVQARIALCTVAAKVLDGADISDKTDREIKEASIKAITKFDCTADHSDEYVNARFDAAIEQVKDADVDRKAEGTSNEINDSSESKADKAQRAQMERYAKLGSK